MPRNTSLRRWCFTLFSGFGLRGDAVEPEAIARIAASVMDGVDESDGAFHLGGGKRRRVCVDSEAEEASDVESSRSDVEADRKEAEAGGGGHAAVASDAGEADWVLDSAAIVERLKSEGATFGIFQLERCPETGRRHVQV